MPFQLIRRSLLVFSFLSAAALYAQDQYLFAYFQEPGTQGIYLALSEDGYHYTPLNDGQPWLKPERQGEIMRDVFLTRGPDQHFQMVWTWDWRGHRLGHASSDDLMHWSPQDEIPIMGAFPDIRNVWAPEVDWDPKAKTWVLFWSSAQTGAKTSDPEGNRIWDATTTDFKAFSTPKIFFDPGYEVIDATMFHGRDREYLVYKDQTREPLRYQVRVATSPSVQGPWTPMGGPITSSWSEGPSVVKIGDAFAVFYDHYRAPHASYQGVQTRDWIHWEDINNKISFPANCKHGSFLKITAEEAARLKARHDPPATAPSTPSVPSN